MMKALNLGRKNSVDCQVIVDAQILSLYNPWAL